MEQALVAVKLLFYLMGGLGLFFLGVGVLSFVDAYKRRTGSLVFSDVRFAKTSNGWLNGKPNMSLNLSRPFVTHPASTWRMPNVFSG